MTGEELPDVSGAWFAAMRRGDWEAAWRATDRLELPRRARQHAPGFERRPEHLRWDGTPPAGRSVLVRCEHGLGDTLQFMRFLPLLHARHVHFLVQPPLVDLLRDAPGLGEVRNYWTDDPLPPHDVDMEVMELAYALRMTVPRLPPPYPHLAERLPSREAFAIADEGRLRVGLVWSCSHWDQSRSAPLADLAPLFALEEVQFFSLQQGEAASDPLLQRLDIEPLSARTTDIRMAAAAMCALDLVISIDSMPVHLAGCLGRPTWVLLKHEADWRWMASGEDSPWYPTVRLFRQPKPGDWRGMAQQVAASLKIVAAAHARRQTVSM
ncbi:ADP-heptose--LPS heptosyltransferase [Ramlibacter sp. USB13]|uniref:ADP-heptose--LPS heptosyltransferase n=1 Tax=Ramlibacter cellulosilyticus TaxID=2764187 RepID=A0A923S9F5_9BURK|nr:ADP-heptose--LPS heptosyltransferase [Ramlibacter cellulosilyticus]MBC5781631.1 ADP-heptose--LPS heptosyltransferase [Ramlibacter cellulosilyticus]